MKKSWLLLSILFVSLQAEEPLLGLLESVKGNQYLLFSIGKNRYECQPYGVLTLEELAHESRLDSQCRESVKQLFKDDPQASVYGRLKLKRFQQYHIEPQGKRCTVYASGTRTYAQMLLREGLAMRKPLLKDERWLYTWKKEQRKARNEKRGLWKNKIWIECMESLYSDEE